MAKVTASPPVAHSTEVGGGEKQSALALVLDQPPFPTSVLLTFRDVRLNTRHRGKLAPPAPTTV